MPIILLFFIVYFYSLGNQTLEYAVWFSWGSVLASLLLFLGISIARAGAAITIASLEYELKYDIFGHEG